MSRVSRKELIKFAFISSQTFTSVGIFVNIPKNTKKERRTHQRRLITGSNAQFAMMNQVVLKFTLSLALVILTRTSWYVGPNTSTTGGVKNYHLAEKLNISTKIVLS